jgi:hypothetical protein
MAEIPVIEPSEIVSGDTIQWKKSLSDYPASDGYTLKYSIINASNKYDITASASGDDHLITISAATSASYAPGIYTWTSYVEKGTDRYTIGSGTIKIKPNLAAQTAGYDNRSHVKKVLDAIEALLEGKASRDAQGISIGGTAITKMAIDELLKWRDKYRIEYQAEAARENIALGKKAKNRIKAQL